MATIHPQALSDLALNARIFFVGIGGVSMSGLALMAKNLGYTVAGSDPHANSRTEHLQSEQIKVHYSHHKMWIDDFQPDIAVYTAAIKRPNPELDRCQELNIPTIDRAEFLGWITRYYSRVINVAGTHGKTTSTSMLASMLIADNFDPSVHLGAEFSGFGGSTVRNGRPGDILVSEACEYNSSLLNFRSTTAILLNIDNDHLDYFKTMDRLISCFAQFIANIPADGQLIVIDKGPHIAKCLAEAKQMRAQKNNGQIKLYSFNIVDTENYAACCEQPEDKRVQLWAEHLIPDYAAFNLTYESGYPCFDFYKQGRFLAHINLQIPGRHNVLNALASLACADLYGANIETICNALQNFHGADGRFEVKGTFQGATIVGDYAHHPTATKATILAASKMPFKHRYVVYQPLTYGRVKNLFNDYVEALKQAEHVLFMNIFSDREKSDFGVSSEQLVEAINKAGGHAEMQPTYEDIKQRLSELCKPGDLVLFLGPEEVRICGQRLADEKL